MIPFSRAKYLYKFGQNPYSHSGDRVQTRDYANADADTNADIDADADAPHTHTHTHITHIYTVLSGGRHKYTEQQ